MSEIINEGITYPNENIGVIIDSKLPVPASTAWYLDSLGEFRGKQELYTRQSPQKLRVLRERALIESAVSSNPD